MENIKYINAGAGTGKTYRITHELAELLGSNKLKPSEVIAATFTVAASAEIKSRARQVLLEKGLISEAAQIETSAIGTIHGVAQMFLRKYWYLLGSTPELDVMSDTDKKIYRNRSISTMLQKADYSSQREAIDRYFEEYRPQKAKDGYIGTEDNPNFWIEDLEAIVGKITYYSLSDKEIEESKAESKSEFCSLYGESKTANDCIDAMFDLAKAWLNEYDSFKLAHSVIDYDDMEKGFLRLLEKKEVVDDIKSNYKLVLVDEFQDCNPIQLKIFMRLAEIIIPADGIGYNSIWVGDPKQSIYSFRGANSKLTMSIVKDLDAEELKKSYRSRKSLVDVTNKVFRTQTFFPETEELGADREDIEGMKASVIHWHFGDGYPNEYKDNLARNIKDLVTSKEYLIQDKETKLLRPVEYKDIAILCHKNNNISSIVSALNKECIPAIAPEKDIIDRAEIQLLLSMILLSEKPDASHEIASVLHLLFDWDTERILRTCIEDKSEGKKEWIADCDEVKIMRTVIAHAKNMSLSEKVATFIIELGLNDKVKKWGEQEIRRQNLKTFYALTKNFEAYCNRFGIVPLYQDFLLYLNSLSDIKAIDDNGADAVKICTYHRSKGLEWPVVLLDGMYDKDKAAYDQILTYNFFGVTEMQKATTGNEQLPSYYLRYFPELNTKTFPLKEDVVKQSAFYQYKVESNHAEMKNILYVGATRARDYLILLSFSKGNTPWLEGINVCIDDFTQNKTDFEKLKPNKVSEPAPVDIDATRKKVEAYERKLQAYQEYVKKIKAEETYRKDRESPKDYTLRNIAGIENLNLDVRYKNPSKLGKKDFNEEIMPEMIEVRKLDNDSMFKNIDEGESSEPKTAMNKIGTCIHNIYAACMSDGSAPTIEEREGFIDTAKQIIVNFGLTEELYDPKELVDSLYLLYEWLTERYGKATAIFHECPINFPLNDQQVIRGDIDLIWQTAEGDVIVDFKNIRGEARELLDKSSTHYVGHHYVPQLLAYKKCLEHAGRTVRACVLYYNIGQAVVF